MKESHVYEVTVCRTPINGHGISHTMLFADWPEQEDIRTALARRVADNLYERDDAADAEDLAKFNDLVDRFVMLAEVVGAKTLDMREPENLYAPIKVAGIEIGTVEVKLLPAYRR